MLFLVPNQQCSALKAYWRHNHTTNFTMKRNAGSLLYINWSGGRCTAGRGHCCSSATHHSKLVTPVNIKLSISRRSASADDGTHMSSLLAAVAASLSGRSGCARGHMCRRLSVTSSGGRRGSSQPLRAGPSSAWPGPAHARPGSGSYINIKWLAMGPAYGPAPALRS